MTKVCILLLKDFQSNDVLTPIEVFREVPDLFEIEYYSSEGGLVSSKAGFCIETESFNELLNKKTGVDVNNKSIALIPGGEGIEEWLKEERTIQQIKTVASLSTWVMSICTGTMLLAKTGLLENKKAVTNGSYLQQHQELTDLAIWEKNTFYTNDGKFYSCKNPTSSIEMVLVFIQEHFGKADRKSFV